MRAVRLGWGGEELSLVYRRYGQVLRAVRLEWGGEELSLVYRRYGQVLRAVRLELGGRVTACLKVRQVLRAVLQVGQP
uniref:Uncharacterized protein n=1 Tax=uncultured Bacteroidota bacterium TaxID=152509 RepID=H5SK34_9BACT|nr:hypothetical protein HGMM_F40B03C08 [uncultured Bacteroidetes bacterium]